MQEAENAGRTTADKMRFEEWFRTIADIFKVRLGDGSYSYVPLMRLCIRKNVETFFARQRKYAPAKLASMKQYAGQLRHLGFVRSVREPEWI